MEKEGFAKCQGEGECGGQCVEFEVANEDAERLQTARDDDGQEGGGGVLCWLKVWRRIPQIRVPLRTYLSMDCAQGWYSLP